MAKVVVSRTVASCGDVRERRIAMQALRETGSKSQGILGSRMLLDYAAVSVIVNVVVPVGAEVKKSRNRWLSAVGCRLSAVTKMCAPSPQQPDVIR